MSDAGRFQVVVREGPPRGDLYQLEQAAYFEVVDTKTGDILLVFQGEMRAGLSTDTGLWDDYAFSGVREVTLSPDGQSVLVQHWDGNEEVVLIPE
jgi:hypothetical protein